VSTTSVPSCYFHCFVCPAHYSCPPAQPAWQVQSAEAGAASSVGQVLPRQGMLLSLLPDSQALCYVLQAAAEEADVLPASHATLFPLPAFPPFFLLLFPAMSSSRYGNTCPGQAHACFRQIFLPPLHEPAEDGTAPSSFSRAEKDEPSSAATPRPAPSRRRFAASDRATSTPVSSALPSPARVSEFRRGRHAA